VPGKSDSGKKSKRPVVHRRDEAQEVVAPMPPAKADAALRAVLSKLGIDQTSLGRRDLFTERHVIEGRELRSYWLHRDFLRTDS
jgi:hypothetical protein